MPKRRWHYSAGIFPSAVTFSIRFWYCPLLSSDTLYFTPHIPIRNCNPRILIIIAPAIMCSHISTTRARITIFVEKEKREVVGALIKISLAKACRPQNARGSRAIEHRTIRRRNLHFPIRPLLRRHDANGVERISRSVCESPAVGPPALPLRFLRAAPPFHRG